jgi:signal transduction histidine kinase
VLEDTLVQSDEVMSAGRELVFNLRAHSRDATDLASALESAATEFSQHYASEFRLHVVGEPRDLNTQVCEELSKLGREALCNAFRHARAQNIEVKIEYRVDALRLAVSDDGVGISNETLAEGGVENHWGLPGMRERAANIGADLRVLSSPGSGTIVQVDIPSRLAYPSVARTKMRKFMRLFKARSLEG